MMLTPSGMAESDGGSVETVVLTDPPDTRHARQARGLAQIAMFHRLYAVAGSVRLIDSERAVVEWLRQRSQF
jgi:hypothetical protein